jgi:4-amino-4-deoxy-L-arabinose transferase-like glycosyltransferase
MQTNDAAPTAQEPTLIARLAWTILILATLYLCYFHNLGAIGLVGPDEPRYAWIARDMAESGDWITPRLYGKPWFEKPPLYYWSAALSFKLFGVSETTARLPSAFCALLVTLSLAWLAWRIYGAETARWLLLLLPTTVAMIGFSHAAATDMPFASMLTLALVFAARLLGLTSKQIDGSVPHSTSASSGGHDFSRAEMPPSLGTFAPEVSESYTAPIHPSAFLPALFLGFFLGLAVLAKGPAAIILSGGAVLLWAIFTKRWRDAFRCLHPLAIASFCLTALPWYILCARRNPDFFRIFIIEHNFKRFLTPEFQHLQPFWYFLPVLLVAFVPWTPLLIWNVIAAASRLSRNDKLTHSSVLLLSFSFFCMMFFSASKSKLPGYILPSIPALGLVIAAELPNLLYSASRARRWIAASCGLLLLALLAVVTRVIQLLNARVHAGVVDDDVVGPLKLVLVVFLLAGLLAVGLALRSKLHASIVTCVLGVLFALVFTLHTSSGARPAACTLDAFSVRSVAMGLESQHQNLASAPIYSFRLKRAEEYSMNYYLRRELAPWRGERGSDVLVLTEVRNRNEARKLGLSCPDLLFEDPIIEVCTTSGSERSLDNIGWSRNNRNPADGQAR